MGGMWCTSSISSSDSVSELESSGVARGPMRASVDLTETGLESTAQREAWTPFKVLSVPWESLEMLSGPQELFKEGLAFFGLLGATLESSVVPRDALRLLGADWATVLTRTSLVPLRRCCNAPRSIPPLPVLCGECRGVN